MTDLAYCGLNCQTCSWVAKTGCPGCREAKGKMFWGECPLAKCCLSKELEHCGKCSDFPCEQLKEFSFNSPNGDGGRRIENLRAIR